MRAMALSTWRCATCVATPAAEATWSGCSTSRCSRVPLWSAVSGRDRASDCERAWNAKALQRGCACWPRWLKRLAFFVSVARTGRACLDLLPVCGAGGQTAQVSSVHLCADSFWTDAKAQDNEGGLQLLSQAEMLSLDSAMLMVQLNIRLLLEVRRHPAG